METTLSPCLSNKRFIIVHGYLSSPKSHWFPWLANALQTRGAQVIAPELPTPESPIAEAWASTLCREIPAIDENTFLIGHSLGCITLLRHLLLQPAGVCAGGYVLVSGFDRTAGTLPALGAFTADPIEPAELRRRGLRRASIISSNDPIVEPGVSRALAAALDTEVIEVANGGHFLGRDGYTEFAAVRDCVFAMAAP